MPPNTQSERPQAPVTLDTPITIKVNIDGRVERLSLPLREFTFPAFPLKLRQLLKLKPDEDWRFERYSDSAGTFVYLDPKSHQVYKTLFRAAKAKLKLRIRATRAPNDCRLEETMARMTALQVANNTTGRSESDGVQCPVTQPTSVPQVPAIHPLPSLMIIDPPAIANEKGATPSPAITTSATVTKSDARASTSNRETHLKGGWVIYCNECKQTIEDAHHYHCSICENGDYDLCMKCVNAGKHCLNDSHWLVKRFHKDGQFATSTTEQIGPKHKSHDEMPGAFLDDKQPVAVESDQSTQQAEEEPDRTCNCCVRVLPEKQFVTCTICEDYDLCFDCHVQNRHGHHPGHTFQAALDEVKLPAIAAFLCKAGRNVRHSAICDGCNKFIYGVRHKCLNCPDWDFCGDCFKSAQRTHPRHRFVPIYEPLADTQAIGTRHVGIYCDGPLCKGREDMSYIEGVRYKCTVCHDTDFCAKCEALPDNKHNHTHPLIKFKTPVRNVSMTTFVESGRDGQPMTQLGDSLLHLPTPRPFVYPFQDHMKPQTVAEVQPLGTEYTKSSEKKSDIHTLLVEPVKEKTPENQSNFPATTSSGKEAASPEQSSDAPKFDAHFLHDTIRDGTTLSAGTVFVKAWTLKNPGPLPWPVGCCVRYVAGDNMLNVKPTRAADQEEMARAGATNAISRRVNPGEEVTFRAILKAPTERLGTMISYWRLHTQDGVPFGHRLWCDIQVVAPSDAPPQFSPPWSQLPATAPPFPHVAQLKPPHEWHRLNTGPAWRESPTSMDPHTAEHMRRASEKRQQMVEDLRVKLARYALADRNNTVAASEATPEQTSEKLQQKPVKCAVMTQTPEKLHEVAATEEASKPEGSSKPAEAATEQEATQLRVNPSPVASETESSRMIFPQLEKESPASSLHEPESDNVLAEEAKSESATSSPESNEEFFEDAESVEIQSIPDDDSFLTDEEYDILDASDEEAE